MMTKSSPARLLATGLGAGFLPIAPGTWGSAEAILIAILVALVAPEQAWNLIAVCAVLATVLGIPASTTVSRQVGKDPSIVVIDEIAGQFVALLFLPFTWPWMIAAFFVFRLFDIVKPFPAKQMEDLPDGWGIMLDDLVAGAYAGLLLWLIGRFL